MLKFAFLLFLFPFLCYSQTESDLDFLVKKIKTDYPGYVEKTKGVNFDIFLSKTILENKADTFKMMSKIVDFFHDRHLDLFRTKDSIDIFSCKRNLSKVLTYFKANKHTKKYEGFWISEFAHCVIAIMQVSNNPLAYKGYVVESRDSTKIPPGMVYYDFEQVSKKDFYTKGIISSSGLKFYVHSEFRNNSVITAGPYNKWKKIKNYSPPLLPFIQEKSDVASGYWIDSNNYVIVIPGSTANNGRIVDSLIKANPAITNRLENLIVDIRSNTGGKTQAYAPLMPLLYTNPILKVNGSIYCTDDYIAKNQKEIDDYVAKGNVDSSYLTKWNEWIESMKANVGKFIETPQDTLTLDTILSYPKRVAFITNYGCQSAAEIFLLEALQSKKVTLFGEHTMGAIDYLNYYPQALPSKKYNLYIATTQRKLRQGEKKLDGIGIYPNVQISDSEGDWIEYVKKYYEKN